MGLNLSKVGQNFLTRSIKAALLGSAILAGCSKNDVEERPNNIERVVPQNPHEGNPNTQQANNSISELLKTTGLTGLVHGSIPGSEMYVFVYGDPIRGGEHYSLIPLNDEIKAKLENIKRHQTVTITGKLLSKGTPQQHVLTEGIKVEKKWEPQVTFKYTNQPYFTLEELKEHLKGKEEINCVVHAVLHDGKVLIINYRENILPVHITDPECTKNLRSSDKISLRYKIREHDEGPLHLSLRIEKDIPPVKVLDGIKVLSDSKEKYKLEGSLVWFPKSPLLLWEVWGLRVKDSNGLIRTYSLHNLRDKKDVKKIDEILQEAWKKRDRGFILSSSSFYHPDIRVEVVGDVVHFAQNQRNPLIDLDSKDIKIHN